MAKTAILLVLFVCCYFAVFAEGRHLTLFENSDHFDNNEDFRANDYECHNLPKRWWHKASSMKTHGHCVALFTRQNCDGPRFMFVRDCEYSECCHNANDFSECKAHNRTDFGEIVQTVELNDNVKSYVIC